jgi:hypothetical protein
VLHYAKVSYLDFATNSIVSAIDAPEGTYPHAISPYFATPAPSSGSAKIELVEYHHADFDHYFLTGSESEITELDNGGFQGWSRTGQHFPAYAAYSAPVGSATVCRFFSTSFAPKSSHFYTPLAEECATVLANPNWLFEVQAFNMAPAAGDGACPVGHTPVYRLYNNGKGGAPNHRYTVDQSVRGEMVAAGWISEGAGALGVIMCSPD